MIKRITLLVACLVLGACASNTVYTPGIVSNSHGQRSNAAIKRWQQYGDIIGDQTITIAKNGETTITVTTPHGTDIPVKRIAVLNKDHSVILGYNEYPQVAASLPSEGTRALFDGIVGTGRAIGSVAGTVFSGIIGIFGAQAIPATAAATKTP